MSAKLLKRLEEYEARLERYKKAFAADGKVDESEMKIIDALLAKIEKIRDALDAKGIITITAVTKMTPFDDKIFKEAFNDSVSDWARTSQIALNSVAHYFRDEEGSGGLSLGDVLSIVKLALTKHPAAALVVETISVVATTVEGLYKVGLPKKPSLSQALEQWQTSLDKYAKQGSYKNEFAAFVKDYKRRENTPASVEEAVEEDFRAACKNVKNDFPSQHFIKKAFVTKMLQNVPDSWDPDSYSGVAEIEMLEMALGFSEPEGQLDDVDAPLMNAIKTVWKNESVINLPVPLHFTIRNVRAGSSAEIRRKSKTPGNTSFKRRRGEKEIFEAFMKTKAYNIPKVSDLTYDD